MIRTSQDHERAFALEQEMLEGRILEGLEILKGGPQCASHVR